MFFMPFILLQLLRQTLLFPLPSSSSSMRSGAICEPGDIARGTHFHLRTRNQIEKDSQVDLVCFPQSHLWITSNAIVVVFCL